jgi:hypothetical protein
MLFYVAETKSKKIKKKNPYIEKSRDGNPSTNKVQGK